jgi:hypothetical protein
MFKPRKTVPLQSWSDPDHIKLYTISATDTAVAHPLFLAELTRLKYARPIPWAQIPAFAIFHAGATMLYLALCWWDNDNELFIAVSVQKNGRWIEDREKYSFCIWDLEVLWHERNSFIRHLYSGERNLTAYRSDLYSQLPSATL